MKHRRDHGQTVRDLVEAALEQSLSRGSTGHSEEPAAHGGRAAGELGQAPAATGPIVGEVLDTHHPHLAGRVLVRWLEPGGVEVERWLMRERHLSLLKGDRVLITLPLGWSQWVVTGALGREGREPEADRDNAAELRLSPGEAVRVISHEGRTLLTLRQGAEGPVLELGEGNVELKARRTLRLSGDTVELAAGNGGVDIRTDGDSVVRARTIRLN